MNGHAARHVLASNPLPRCLVLVGANDRVHAPQMLPPDPARAFDIAVWGCGDLPPANASLRFPALGRLLRDMPSLWQPYDLIWLPDETVQTRGSAVATMCALMQAHDLWLAQPSLDWTGPDDELLERHNPAFTLRSTNWVSERMPCFRREFLAAVLDSFALATGDPGLGHLWAALAPRGRVAVLDGVSLALTGQQPVRVHSGADEWSTLHRRALEALGVSDLSCLSWGGVDTAGRVLALHDKATRHAFVGRLMSGWAAGMDDASALGALLERHLAASPAEAPQTVPEPVPARPSLRRSPILAA